MDGEPEAPSFATFYSEQYGRVVAVVQAMVGHHPQMAEELAQDAFARALRRWDEVCSYERADTWVRTVALNLARSRFRRMAAERRARARLGPAESVSPERITDRDRDEQVWAQVRRLPRQQAVAVVLRYVDEMSSAEAASVMGCAEATVRVHLHRARQTLAERLGSLTERTAGG